MSAHDRRRNRHKNRHVSPTTIKRRVHHGLSTHEIDQAKQLRDLEWSCKDIAINLQRTERQIELALASTRSPNPQNPQACIYTNRATQNRFREQALPGETAHQTLVRLLEEHAHFQRLILG